MPRCNAGNDPHEFPDQVSFLLVGNEIILLLIKGIICGIKVIKQKASK